MLKQMLSDDRNEVVREAVTKSLALVVAFIENVDKYEQVILLEYFLASLVKPTVPHLQSIFF